MGTAIVLLVLCAIVGAVIYKMVKDTKWEILMWWQLCRMRYGLSPVKRDEIVFKRRLPYGGLFEYRMDCMVYNLQNLGYNTEA